MRDCERNINESEAIKALRLEGGIEISGKSTRVSEFVQALDMVINALEKQIAKKAIITGHNNAINTDVGYWGIVLWGMYPDLYFDQIGKTVFLTQTETEKKLKEMERC